MRSICCDGRWTLDIYATPVLIDDVHEMLHAPELKARVEVADLNDKFDVYKVPVREDDESLAYRWLCRCEYLVPCLSRMLGGGPTYKADSSGEKKKKQRRRRRKSYGDEDEDEEGDSEEESETKGLLG